MTLRLGMRFDGFDPAPETIEIARQAVDAGASAIWMAEHLGYREAAVSCMAFALRTRHAMVIPAAVTPYLFHPMPTAMSLATMAEAVPGRVGVAVAVGNTLDLKESGKQPAEPVRAVADFVADLRALWTTEPVERETGPYRPDGARILGAAKLTGKVNLNTLIVAMGLVLLVVGALLVWQAYQLSRFSS